ncbi:MAG: RHS repeat-associated core domain-containing protein [Bacteroidota bacterium]
MGQNWIFCIKFYPFGLKHKGYNEAVSPLGNSVANKWKYNDKELEESLGLNWYDYGARNYDATIGKWMNVDPMADKYLDMSPYNYTANNPVYFVDPDGMDVEPALNQSGTIQQAVQQWRNQGLTTVEQIKDFVTNKNIDGNGGAAVRYVYTEDNGWIDLQHYAGVQVYGKTAMDALEPASGNSLMQALFFGEGANNSYYSYEDLPSNAFSAEIDLNGLEGEDLFNVILEHFGGANATNPEEAPNYEQIPNDDQDRSRLPENTTTEFDDASPSRTRTSKEPDKSKLKTGNYIPQNRTSKPYDLNNFDPANTSIENKRKINSQQ